MTNKGSTPMAQYWVRNYVCNNPDCCDGEWTIQVTHTSDTTIHECSWCGERCEYVGDVTVVNTDPQIDKTKSESV